MDLVNKGLERTGRDRVFNYPVNGGLESTRWDRVRIESLERA